MNYSSPTIGVRFNGHGGAWSVVGIGSASRDADLPLRLENASVRMAVDRLHALGIPLTVMYTEIEA